MTITDKKRQAAAQTLRALGIRPEQSLPDIYTELSMTEGGSYASLLGTHIHKAELGVARGALNAVQYLSPDVEAGIEGHTSCPFATPGCVSTCIKTTGHNVTSMAQRARVKRTLRWYLDPLRTAQDALAEVSRLERRAARQNLVPTVRFNGTSDDRFWAMVPGWEERATRFYDYTKRPPTQAHVAAHRRGWTTTFSLSEAPNSARWSEEWARHGANTAIVVGGPVGSTQTVAKKVAAELVRRGEFVGRRTINGDQDDLRWMDPQVGGWVVLSAKGGKVKHEQHGFVVRFDPAVLLGTDWPVERALLSVFDRQRFNLNAAAAAK